MICPLCPATVGATNPGTSAKPMADRGRIRSITGAMPEPSTSAQRRPVGISPPVVVCTSSRNFANAADMAASLAGVRQPGGDHGRLQAVLLAAHRLGNQLGALLLAQPT